MKKSLQPNNPTDKNKRYHFQISFLEETILSIYEAGSPQVFDYQKLHTELQLLIEEKSPHPLGLVLNLQDVTSLNGEAKKFHYNELLAYCKQGRFYHVAIISPEAVNIINSSSAPVFLENTFISYHSVEHEAIKEIFKRQSKITGTQTKHDQETQALLDDIKNKNAELTQKKEELDYFVYSVSHDLRAPVATIQGLIQVLKIEENNPSLFNYLEMVDIQIARIEKYIREINEYAWNSKLELEVEAIDFHPLIEEIQASLQSIDGINEISWEISIKTEGHFFSDKQRIQLAMMHLCANSIKFRSMNGKENIIKINVQAKDNEAIITIEDNGIGIEDKYLSKIFDMFFTTTDRTKGNGLGLYTTLQTVKKLGGHIDVKSTPKKGSIFSLVLPANSVAGY